MPESDMQMEPDTTIDEADTTDAMAPTVGGEERQSATAEPTGIWNFDAAEEHLYLEARIDTNDLEELVAAFNARFPHPEYPGIESAEMRDDTALVELTDDEQLTERMGTTGSLAYLARVTYTLTSLNNVERVRFEFEEGSHAAPGTYSRENFERFVQP